MVTNFILNVIISTAVDRAVQLHGDMEAARAIALSLFGNSWENHVINVYDRLVLAVTPGEDKHAL